MHCQKSWKHGRLVRKGERHLSAAIGVIVSACLNSNEFVAQDYAISLAPATCLLAKECYSDRSNTQRPKEN